VHARSSSLKVELLRLMLPVCRACVSSFPLDNGSGSDSELLWEAVAVGLVLWLVDARFREANQVDAMRKVWTLLSQLCNFDALQLQRDQILPQVKDCTYTDGIALATAAAGRDARFAELSVGVVERSLAHERPAVSHFITYALCTERTMLN